VTCHSCKTDMVKAGKGRNEIPGYKCRSAVSGSLSRLTNAFPKKWENLWYTTACGFAYYKSRRIHQTLRLNLRWPLVYLLTLGAWKIWLRRRQFLKSR
jgi:hypothetical protein